MEEYIQQLQGIQELLVNIEKRRTVSEKIRVDNIAVQLKDIALAAKVCSCPNS
jgi:hypothetical protein